MDDIDMKVFRRIATALERIADKFDECSHEGAISTFEQNSKLRP